MAEKLIKCVDTHRVYENADDYIGRRTGTITYMDGTTEKIQTFSVPAEVELFCGKAYADVIYDIDEQGRHIKDIHYEGCHPCYNSKERAIRNE